MKREKLIIHVPQSVNIRSSYNAQKIGIYGIQALFLTIETQFHNHEHCVIIFQKNN